MNEVVQYDLRNGQPLPFFFYERARREFRANPEALKLLRSHRHVSFVFNTGQPNIGKSYLLNHIFDLQPPSRGFAPNTQNIVIWSQPVVKDQLAVYVVDVQGFGEDQFFSDFAWQLSFLLGSVIVFSTRGAIDETAWRAFSGVKYLLRHLKFSPDPSQNEFMMSYYAPLFVWCVKDADANVRSPQGQRVTGNEYLEMMLRTRSGGRGVLG